MIHPSLQIEDTQGSNCIISLGSLVLPCVCVAIILHLVSWLKFEQDEKVFIQVQIVVQLFETIPLQFWN